MKQKVISINIIGTSDEQLQDIQLELFKQNYSWVSSGKEVRKYVSDDYIVIIDNIMYTMDKNSIKYYSNDEYVNLINIDNITNYFRHLKIKKIMKNEKFN
jgi:hypothetical protein